MFYLTNVTKYYVTVTFGWHDSNRLYNDHLLTWTIHTNSNKHIQMHRLSISRILIASDSSFFFELQLLFLAMSGHYLGRQIHVCMQGSVLLKDTTQCRR